MTGGHGSMMAAALLLVMGLPMSELYMRDDSAVVISPHDITFVVEVFQDCTPDRHNVMAMRESMRMEAYFVCCCFMVMVCVWVSE
eukprot:CAMPEP_0198118394 /NCGR_PEP_ID=MMETSP1442-20131203/21541_1 /TAXON_ID= /ORGANISM="Craspedostauros australis, Strain CCMP3328" /LENGTH=84 /DNA_ID=CAMNT_0043776647 /DNA_START=454 /DNA_END=708 /DNA_ORIENTATION=-